MNFITRTEAFSEEPGSLDIYCRFAVGSTGAIGAFSRCSNQIVKASVVRSSAGIYKLPFQGSFYAVPALPGGTVPSPLLDHSVNVIGTVTTTDGTIGHVTVDNSGNQDASGNSFVTIEFTAGADGTAADVKSGNEVSVHLTVKTGP